MPFYFYVALCIFFYIYLSIAVIIARRRCGAIIGDIGNMQLLRSIRAHGNFSEYAPLFLIALGSAEHAGLSHHAIHFFGLFFFSGRILHAYSLLYAEHWQTNEKPFLKFRQIGMAATFLCLVLLAGYLLIHYFNLIS